MSKVICDICGTTYQDTADCCPICGCSREIAAELAQEDFLVDGMASRPNGKKREIFDFDEVNPVSRKTAEAERIQDYDGEDEEQSQDAPRHNTFLVVLLTVLIVALLCVTGFLFVKYFLPNMGAQQTQVPTDPPQTVAAVTEETGTVQTTELRIPCTSLALASGSAELTEEGSLFLLNVIRTPEDTTDELIFSSEDESIATVSADGRITAVAEGQTTVNIVCGDQRISLPVICDFPEPTEETTVATEDATEATQKNVVLKLKKSDIRLQVYYYFTLELDCDLEASEVEWSSEHPYIATVDENGVVTAIKTGTTEITAKYGDQEAKCIIRCYQ